MPTTGYLKRLTRRLTEDLGDADAVEIAEESRASGAQRAAECCRGDEVTMHGELRSVETCSRAAKVGVKAEFFDGSDTVMLKWLGRNRIPGIEPGRKITVRGRLAEHDGTKLIYNPYYELQGPDDE
ncbi:OB-fold nucleic acid binding domain-containing protein [Gordonia sp. Z-3]|jgi:RecG-like helicase|uniref:OB-fold nucleic acid binding domain-containing protein n=2 Tax=Gordonia TaxID=2053 RepID=A0A9X3I6G0_9ACTN|nr:MULTISPECIES: OB-fold nucleic acid binding domain-containing protein [Gordonia]MAU82844.1 DNA-binding protein [Gordonia sp. (in: high G+C Gram-positive bacteria)]MCF3937532.1 OB-fold nucleic acid binding domain-containing protein [Gordonia tangerina]MCX2965489.1 OB-fold nucleic acid binding domain-containing protein [Gordonia aquimaris]MED5800238.1 OB-fold nucleic acid binding domain-containing protein [Gordonia sp. Z-3]